MEVSDAELLHFVTENGIVNVREVLASYEMKKYEELHIALLFEQK